MAGDTDEVRGLVGSVVQKIHNAILTSKNAILITIRIQVPASGGGGSAITLQK